MKKQTTLLMLLALAIAPGALRASPETDRKIEDAARASYNYRVILQENVKVRANDGVVTLTGTVADQSQKVLAEDTVASLPGVTTVENKLTLDGKRSERSDDWIEFKIKTRLLTKANVSATETHIDVKDGIVTLTGTAESRAQKDLTEAYAKDIQGVKSVKNEMTVFEPTGRQRVGEVIDDASITAQVKYELLTHSSTSALRTKVETHDGIVNIRGEADSEAEKELVSKLAGDVRGTKSVNNEMTLKVRKP